VIPLQGAFRYSMGKHHFPSVEHRGGPPIDYSTDAIIYVTVSYDLFEVIIEIPTQAFHCLLHTRSLFLALPAHRYKLPSNLSCECFSDLYLWKNHFQKFLLCNQLLIFIQLSTYPLFMVQ